MCGIFAHSTLYEDEDEAASIDYKIITTLAHKAYKLITILQHKTSHRYTGSILTTSGLKIITVETSLVHPVP